MKNRSGSYEAAAQQAAPTVVVKPDKLLRSIIDVVCIIDEQGVFQYLSPSSLQLFGYTPDEMQGHSFLRFIFPADIEKTVALAGSKATGCQTSHFTNRYRRKDGRVVPVLWSGRWDEEDRLLYCVARDGSDKFEIEQRLLKAQQMAGVANYEFDVVGGCYTYTSDSVFDLFGVNREQHPVFTSELFWSLVHPDDLPLVKQHVLKPEQLLNDSLSYRIIRPGGEVVHINRHREIIRDAAGHPLRIIGTLQDITSQKKSECVVRQSEERFRFLVQNGNDLIGIINAEGTYLFVSDNVERHLGLSAEEMVGHNALQFIHPEDVEAIAELLKSASEKESFTTAPFRFQNGAGEWRWMETTVTNHLHHPAIGGLVVNSRDVTERKRKDDALMLSQQRFEALMQNGSDLIVIIDEKANFNYGSNNLLAVLGYTHEELAGRNAFEFIHPADRQKVADEMSRLLRGEYAGLHHRFLHKNGNWVWLESKATDHRKNSAIGGILVNSRSIDDRVQLQHRLNRELISKQREITAAAIRAQEAERSQLGLELHDNVNQILTTVKLYNEMYLTGYHEDKTLLEKAMQYTQDCINEIRSISKRLSGPTLGKISLQDSVKELVDSINLTRRVEIIYVPQGISGFVFSEDLHLAIYRIVQEGLNNILKYSLASIACIEIGFRNEYLRLAITDNGKGFDTGAARAGIGIANMKTRAENLNGSFDIRSAPGNGCEIEILFPCDDHVRELACSMTENGAEQGQSK